MRIYAITTASDIDPRGAEDNMAGLFDQAHVGFFTDREQARKAVLDNAGDIHELNQNVAIIESIDEGLYGCDPNDRMFFRWNEARYEETDWPKAMKNITGFCMG